VKILDPDAIRPVSRKSIRRSAISVLCVGWGATWLLSDGHRWLYRHKIILNYFFPSNVVCNALWLEFLLRSEDNIDFCRCSLR
jgi:hypothetical protein